jgi:hypothetical protein
MDVENIYGVTFCNKTYSLVSPPAYVTLLGTTITVDPTQAGPGDVGTKVITLEVNSLEFSGTVPTSSYTFTLIVQHCVVNSYAIAPIPDTMYVIPQGALNIPFTEGVWGNLACLYA